MIPAIRHKTYLWICSIFKIVYLKEHRISIYYSFLTSHRKRRGSWRRRGGKGRRRGRRGGGGEKRRRRRRSQWKEQSLFIRFTFHFWHRIKRNSPRWKGLFICDPHLSNILPICTRLSQKEKEEREKLGSKIEEKKERNEMNKIRAFRRDVE